MVSERFDVAYAGGNLVSHNQWTTVRRKNISRSVNAAGQASFYLSNNQSNYILANGSNTDFSKLGELSGFATFGKRVVYVDSDIHVSGDTRVKLLILEFDKERKRNGQKWIEIQKSVRAVLEPETAYVIFGVYLTGQGSATIQRVYAERSDETVKTGDSPSVKSIDESQFGFESKSFDDVVRRISSANSLLSTLSIDLQNITKYGQGTPFTPEVPKKTPHPWKDHPQVNALLESGIFDAGFYSVVSGGVFNKEADAASHFLTVGMPKLLTCNVLVNPRTLPMEVQGYWRQGNLDKILGFLRQPRQRLSPISEFFEPKLIQLPGATKIDHPGGCLGWFLENAKESSFIPSSTYAVRWGGFKKAVELSVEDHLKSRDLLKAELSDTWNLDAQELFKEAARDKKGTQDPLISVIMPVWNRRFILDTAVKSVQNQSYTNWELIIVDDGSEDDSLTFAQILAEKDSRIRVFPLEHGGVCRARNHGIEKSMGKYMAFLDSDNEWDPDFLEIMVAEAESRGLKFSYAVQELHGVSGVRYRAIEGGVEKLALKNHIDLNVVLLESKLVRRVGGFDESLRRWVDHDLALRLAKNEPPTLIPIIGCIYDDKATERITSMEPDSWQWVVLEKHWVDWVAAASSLKDRTHGRVSIVMPMYGQHKLTETAIRSILSTSHTADLEVVLVDNGSDFESTWRIRAIFSGDSRVKFLRLPRNLNFSIGSNFGAANSSGEYVLFLNNDTEVQEGWLDPLLQRMSDSEVMGVQPLLLFPDDSIQSAGTVFVAKDIIPAPFLVKMPREDAKKVDDLKFSAITAAAMVVRAADVVKLKGFDPKFINGMEDVDFCLRAIQNGGHFGVEPSSIVRHHESKTPGRGANIVPNRLEFIRRWKGRLPNPELGSFEKAGFQIAAISSDGHEIAGPRVKLSRASSTIERWGIKYSANGGPRGDKWGDTFFVHSLAESLERAGKQVVTYRHGANVDYDNALDDVNFVIRGIDRIAPIPGQINILWIISHPEDVTTSEIMGFDLVYAASLTWSERIGKKVGRTIGVLHQATDVKRFNMGVEASSQQRPAVFVGSVHPGRRRAIVEDAVAAQVDLCVIGDGWRGQLPGGILEADRVDNSLLASVYRSGSRVLADHWPEMAEEGFLQNRLFDAVACGCRVISDPVEGVDAIFHGAVQTYNSLEELRYLCSEEGLKEFPSDNELSTIAAAIVKNHSFDARVAQLMTAIEKMKFGVAKL